jgi:molybdenum ABC transporter molybdate-binding protein
MKNGLKKMGLSSVAGGVGLLALLWPNRGGPANTLVVFCASGAQRPMERIAREYEKTYGTSIQLQYGGSGTLLSNLQLTDRADLFLAADRSYIELAHKLGLVVDEFPVVNQRAVVAVQKGNPLNIQSLEDLRRPALRLSLGNPAAASIGRHTKKILQEAGLWAEVRESVQRRGVFKPMVTDLANDVRLGAVDAAVVWDNVAVQYPDLEAIHIPEFDAVVEQITVALLESIDDPEAARHFIRYLTASDRGLRIFAEAGYDAVDGAPWIE